MLGRTETGEGQGDLKGGRGREGMMSIKGPRGRLAIRGTGPVVGLDRKSEPRHGDLGRQRKVGLGSARHREHSRGFMPGWGRANDRAALGRTVWR